MYFLDFFSYSEIDRSIFAHDCSLPYVSSALMQHNYVVLYLKIFRYGDTYVEESIEITLHKNWIGLKNSSMAYMIWWHLFFYYSVISIIICVIYISSDSIYILIEWADEKNRIFSLGYSQKIEIIEIHSCGHCERTGDIVDSFGGLVTIVVQLYYINNACSIFGPPKY